MKIEWINVDGGPLEVARWGSGSDCPILLLHEGLGSIQLWKNFPERLAQSSGRQVVAWSRKGHGWSAPYDGQRIQDYMHREADLLPKIHDALDLIRAHWLGHSDGGSIALIAAALFPDLAASLILEAPHVTVEDVTLESIAKVASGFAGSDMSQRMQRYHAHPRPLFLGWSAIWLDPTFLRWNIEEVLGRVTAPTLLIQGHEDQYGTMKQLDLIAAAVANTTRLELENCGHSAHFDREHAVIDAICAFLKGKE